MEEEPTPGRCDGMRFLVGNTPLLAVRYTLDGSERTVYAKAEHLNLTGSIKDRMALHILRRAYAEGRLASGDMIAEATSGNTGISFAALGAALGHPVTIFMPKWMSQERIDLIQGFGADIRLVAMEEGGFLGSIQMAEDLAKSNGHVFLPRQFSNEANVEAHETGTGPEIWWQMRSISLYPDAFVAGIGTGGTVMGVGRFLRSRRKGIQVHPLEPIESPTLSTGHKVGKHRIQGVSDEFIPDIVQLTDLDEILGVHDGDAIQMAQKLCRDLGIAVGISSGANLVGAILAQESLGPEAAVVTVLPDDNKKYLSTDLMKEEPTKEGYVTPRVKLLGFQAVRRVCRTCRASD